jgi:hypothetical protein
MLLEPFKQFLAWLGCDYCPSYERCIKWVGKDVRIRFEVGEHRLQGTHKEVLENAVMTELETVLAPAVGYAADLPESCQFSYRLYLTRRQPLLYILPARIEIPLIEHLGC